MSADNRGGASTVVDVAVPSAEVFRLLADIEQLPRWAPRLFYALEVGREGWSAYTPWGELKLELMADAVTGFVALEVRLGREVRGVFSLWVSAGDAGGTRVRLMSFPEREVLVADAVLDAMYAGLRGELPGLGRALAEGWSGPRARVGLIRSAA